MVRVSLTITVDLGGDFDLHGAKQGSRELDAATVADDPLRGMLGDFESRSEPLRLGLRWVGGDGS